MDCERGAAPPGTVLGVAGARSQRVMCPELILNSTLAGPLHPLLLAPGPVRTLSSKSART